MYFVGKLGDEKGDSGEDFEAMHVVWKRHDGYFVYR